jgi:hypothetical protein
MSRLVRVFYPNKVTDRGLGLGGKLKKIVDRRYVMGDFNTLDAASLASLVRRAAAERADAWSPVVLIGHSKSCYYLDELHRFFRLVRDERWDFPTLRQTLGRLQ